MALEFLIGGLSASGACLVTNPLEVAKTRMQLQGELVARGQHAVHYRNVVHAFYTIGRVDGLLALQKGLVPAVWYQFVMNGVRLGFYQRVNDMGLTKDKNGRVSVGRSVAAGAFSGCLGSAVASPLYMVKTHLQSRANAAIAVGHQHEHTGGMAGALRMIFVNHGFRGLWRGVTAAVMRVSVGSATQLATFSWTKEHIVMMQLFSPTSWLNALAASMTSGVVVVMMMTPFDVVSTRLYNQGTDAAGRGLLYRNVTDCFVRTFVAEGVWGFYKGAGASFFRLGPHTVLSLLIWNQLQIVSESLTSSAKVKS